MRLLDRHITRELIGPFLFGVAAFTSLMFAGRELFRITELLAEYNASPLTALKLVALFVPSLVVMTLPMSMLLAALLGFGRLSGDSEVVALFASGVSLYRVAVPVAVMAVLVTGLSFALNEVVVPGANREHERIFKSVRPDASNSKDKAFIVADSRDDSVSAVVFVKGGLNTTTGVARDVSVVKFSNGRPSIFVYGREANWRQISGSQSGNEWVFRDGYYQLLGGRSNVTVVFDGTSTYSVRINKTPEQLALYQRKPDEMSFSELNGYIRMLEEQDQDVREYRVKLYQKLSLPLASLVFALIGTPLGLRPQRSSSAMGLGLSIVIIFAYWVLLHYMTILGDNGAVSPAAANFIPTLAGACAGIGLIVRAAK